MSYAPANSSQPENEEQEVFDMLFPFLQDDPSRLRSVDCETDFTELLESLMPGAGPSAIEARFCCLCQEDIKENENFTNGLGCPCTATFFHTNCFGKYLKSCETEARCPCCRSAWSEEVIVID